MINSRKKPIQDGYPEDYMLEGYTDEQVDAMNADLEAENRDKITGVAEYIQNHLRDVLNSTHFNPNDDITRNQVRVAMIELLEQLHEQLHVKTFEVICDNTNNTPSRIDNGELHVDIMVVPQWSRYPLSCGGIASGKTIFNLDEELMCVGSTGLLSQATVPVNQIVQDDDLDDEDVLTIIGNAAGPGGGGGNGGFVIGSGINASGVMSAGSGAYIMSSVQSIQSMVGQLTLDLTVNQDPDLPAIVFNGYDYDEKKISMSLQPESTISTVEAFKIMLLINAATHTPHKFSTFAYIKKNNLERHFKFTQ